MTRTEKDTGDQLADPPVVVDDEVFTSTMRYDCLNRLVATSDQGPTAQPGDLLRSQLGYDSRGNRTVTIDPKGNTSLTVFDGASRAIDIHQQMRTDGDGTKPPVGGSFAAEGRGSIRTQSVLDANGRVKQLIDDRGAATAYAYDTLDRKTTMEFVDGSEQTSVYNAASDMVTNTDENARSWKPPMTPSAA